MVVPAAREGFELDNNILTVFERFEVVEIGATDDGIALGIEVDVTYHEAVTSMVARVVERLGSERSRIAPWVVELLATDLSHYVTGVVIPIDGGLVRG